MRGRVGVLAGWLALAACVPPGAATRAPAARPRDGLNAAWTAAQVADPLLIEMHLGDVYRIPANYMAWWSGVTHQPCTSEFSVHGSVLSTTSYHYDDHGRLAFTLVDEEVPGAIEDGPYGGIISEGSDHDGVPDQREEVTRDEQGRAVEYRGRSFAYADGRLDRIVDTLHLYRARYDDRGRLVTLERRELQSPPCCNGDDEGQEHWETEVTFVYDEHDRLRRRERSHRGVREVTHFRYDDAADRLEVEVVSTYASSGKSQRHSVWIEWEDGLLVRWQDYRYLYDAAGRLVEERRPRRERVRYQYCD